MEAPGTYTYNSIQFSHQFCSQVTLQVRLSCGHTGEKRRVRGHLARRQGNLGSPAPLLSCGRTREKRRVRGHLALRQGNPGSPAPLLLREATRDGKHGFVECSSSRCGGCGKDRVGFSTGERGGDV